MRLLNVSTLRFTDFSTTSPPPYAIASHRWVENETTFEDFEAGRKNTQGYRKVQAFASFVKARIPQIEWLWIDTCCIDKRSSNELSTSINSMFQWYQNSSLCLAYLFDVPDCNLEAFQHSVWFKRGWTLQELLAPKTVVFLTNEWKIIGYKGAALENIQCMKLHSLIAARTGITESILADWSNSQEVSVEEKWAWMDGRKTTCDEDESYCLLGIFGVSMNIRYGGEEAGRRTRDRLEAKIRKTLHPSGDADADIQKLNLQLSIMLQQGLLTPLVESTFCRSGTSVRHQAILAGNGDGIFTNERVIDHTQHLGRSKRGHLRKKKPIIRMKLRLPFTTQVWDLALAHASSGWDMSIRTYNLLPYSSKIFQCCILGDLQSMQELVACGQASWLDQQLPYEDGGDKWTLLEIAAWHGHFYICHYLLQEVSWPDQSDVMFHTLSRIPRVLGRVTDDFIAAMYRLLLQEHELGVDILDKPFRIARPKIYWPILINSLPFAWDELSFETRYRIVESGTRSEDFQEPADMLSLIGLPLRASQTAILCTSDGYTLLHMVAECVPRSLLRVSQSSEHVARAQRWLDFGANLVENGIDPHCMSSGSTALHLYLERVLGDWLFRQSRASDYLTIWLEMILAGGIKQLEGYVQRENELLRTSPLRLNLADSTYWVTAVIWNAGMHRWVLEVERAVAIPVYRIPEPPPGIFEPSSSSENRIPTTICWKPTARDTADDHMIPVRWLSLWSSPFEFPKEDLRWWQPYNELVEQSQDDASEVVLLVDRSSRYRASKSRSSSAPRPLYSHRAESFAIQLVAARPWLLGYHLCPRDSKRRSGCCHSSRAPGVMLEVVDIRDCMQSSKEEVTSIHESWDWTHRSFLAVISACKRPGGYRWTQDHYPVPLRHSFEAGCPQGCDAVDAKQLDELLWGEEWVDCL